MEKWLNEKRNTPQSSSTSEMKYSRYVWEHLTNTSWPVRKSLTNSHYLTIASSLVLLCIFISVILSRLNSINAIVVICFNCDTWEHSYEHFNKHWESRLSMHKQSGLYLTKDWQESKDHFGFYARDGHVDAGKAPTPNIGKYICANIAYMHNMQLCAFGTKLAHGHPYVTLVCCKKGKWRGINVEHSIKHSDNT